MKSYLLFFFASISFVLAGEPHTPPTRHLNEVEIHFRDKHFTPQTVVVQSGKPVVLRVVNDSTERIEFESFKLHREIVISGGDRVVIHLPKLKPGKYDFFDDFNEDVPDGQILAR